MDAGTVLEQYTHELSNLPAELAFLLEELKEHDLEFYANRKKLQQYDAQIHKFIKSQGSLTPFPKEDQLYPKIRQLFKKCEEIQDEKCKLANTGLFAVAKHLARLESDIEKLEKDGLLHFDENYTNESDMELTSVAAVSMRSRKSRKSSRSTPVDLVDDESEADEEPPLKKVKAETVTAEGVKTVARAPRREQHPNTPVKDGEDQTLYCFCRQVSFGEMIACDNSKCQYEWFHYKCVGLTAEPTGKWYCPDCVKKLEKRKKKK